MQNSDFIKDFIEEAAGHIEAVEEGLLNLEQGNGDADTINSIFRSVHSLKGTAGFFNLKNIVDLSHAMENLFGEIRNGNLIIENFMIDILLSANDCLKLMVSNVDESEDVDIQKHMETISDVLNNKKQSGILPDLPSSPGIITHNNSRAFLEGGQTVVQDAKKRGHHVYRVTPNLQKQPAEILSKVKSVGHILGSFHENNDLYSFEEENQRVYQGDLLISSVLEKSLMGLALNLPLESIVELNDEPGLRGKSGALPPSKKQESMTLEVPTFHAEPLLRESQVFKETDESNQRQQSSGGDDIIRVHISLLNDLLNLASEMVLGRNRLLRILEIHRKGIPGLNAVLQNVDGITTELQEKIMQTRMQPVAKVFNKFPRIIRELSRKMGKDIELRLEGSEVELDKSIIETLGDPLTHLVRNAVDHGIEMPELREKNGKNRAGTIALKAYHEGGFVNIGVEDDGVGIDVENVKEKALQKGLISHAEVSQMGERQVLDLIFRPGFSTAEKVTDVSGRGVGMDVVKNNIEKLGGAMDVMINPGQGTTFHLTIPLTLAIISSLIVEVKGQKFALPQVNLQGMVRIKPGDPYRKIERIQDYEVLRLMGKLLPIVRLADILDLQPNVHESNQVIQVLVIKNGFKRFGLVVDLIHGGEEILVKPLPRYLKDCKSYSGATILGDGRIAMILDPEGIATRAGLRFMDELGEMSGRGAAIADNMTERQNLLLFKCSGPETFSIDLSMVARVEKINYHDLERVGKKEFILFRGEALRVIRPETYLPVIKGKRGKQELYVIIPKLVKHPIGILIEKVLDTVESKLELNLEVLKAKGMIGSAVLDNRIILLLNIYELFEMAAPDSYRPKEIIEAPQEKKTILLAEDTPFFAKMEKMYLESAGYNVLTALNGREAWDLLEKHKVDAVVSDIEMPFMDGLELVKRIRANNELGSLPVVAVTSRADERSISRGIDAGFDFYEIKLDRERLLEKISLAFQKRGGLL